MIVKKSPRYKKPKIDLTGPDGNAFFLIGTARKWMKKIEPERVDHIVRQMISGDYIKVVAYFEIYFGNVCDLEMDECLMDEVQKKIEGIRGTEDIEWNLQELGINNLI